MARLWKAFVLVVALALVACEAQRPPTHEDIVEQALEAFNNGRPGKPLFCLIDVTMPSGQNPTSNFPLKFSISETDCISVPERQPQNCNLLENGVSLLLPAPRLPYGGREVLSSPGSVHITWPLHHQQF
ncbi:neutrophilic granule protein-like [Peromyscus californicus insignis]|uniref:neutrophilic granule protein-like n=1 Tax=Peromyscus californicus insignis TaxID=564181 RepID=UPI0022A7A842|nr:neutrophilic granule protein-like [Peromyscus californicus insignis]